MQTQLSETRKKKKESRIIGTGSWQVMLVIKLGEWGGGKEERDREKEGMRGREDERKEEEGMK